MKALQLVPAMEFGGVEQYVVQLNRFLVNAGWRNVVVSSGGRLESTVREDGGDTIRLDVKSKNPLSALPRAIALRRILAAEKPDVVCAHSRVPAWLFAMAGRGLRIPLITFAHGANSVSRYSRVMTSGDIVMCPSTFVRDYLARAYGTPQEKFRVVAHAVDAARFDPDAIDGEVCRRLRREWKLEGRRTVMSVGRITRLKGFDVLLNAFAMLKAKDSRLVIVGGAEAGKEAYLAELKSLAARLHVSDRVTFAGAMAEIPECLSLADVVVSSNVAKPESFGLSMVEALQMGKPVIAKAFGGAIDIVRDGSNGFLVPTGSPQEFASAIDNALSGKVKLDASQIREDARKRFSLDRMERETLAVYGELT